MRYTRFGLALLALLTLTPLSTQAAPSLGSMLDRATHQRMLTQRAVRYYAQIGQFIEEERARDELARTLELFQSQLDELKTHAPTLGIQEALGKVEQAWRPFKAIASAPVTREQAAPLHRKGETLMQASHDVALQLQALAKTNAGRLVSLSGHQRMLSQRLASLYLLQSWGLENPEYLDDYLRAREDFDATHRQLKAATVNTPAIHATLNDIERQWHMYKVSAHLDQEEFIPLLITLSTEKMLNNLDVLTAQYAALPH